MSLPYNGKIISKAKQLRRNMTPQERKLWYLFLRTYRHRFQRQKVIDNYIVDFFCAKVKLAIEIDGSQHFTEESMLNDTKRSNTLSKSGVKVIRFSNRDIDTRFKEVCEQINFEIHSLLPLSHT